MLENRMQTRTSFLNEAWNAQSFIVESAVPVVCISGTFLKSSFVRTFMAVPGAWQGLELA